MKRKILSVVSVLALSCLASCGGKDKEAQSRWKEAADTKDFYGYIAEKADEINMEALKQEAEAADSSPEQQFQAVTLLCALDFQKGYSPDQKKGTQDQVSEADRYRYDYPDSRKLAEQFLSMVQDKEKEFQEALEEAFYPYDCLTSLFAAADRMDAGTLAALRNVPDDRAYADKLSETVDRWVEKNPEDIAEIASVLSENDYFEEWDLSKWKQTYFFSYLDENQVRTDTMDEAASYVSYLRDSMMPELKKKFGGKEFVQTGERTGQKFYATGLTVTVEEDLKLEKTGKKKQAQGRQKDININGKTVAAFYRNPDTDKWKGSPARLRLLGDFMLGLPKKEYPSAVSKADYYLVLTPGYQEGDFYRDQSGKKTKVREVYSSTSIDLYKGGSGKFLRHLGNVSEQPDATIFEDLTAEMYRYPKVMPADVLSLIYHNVNNPDSYVTLIDHTEGKEAALQAGEPVILGNWEITYQYGQIVKSFDEGMFRYTAKDGCQYVRAEITVKNIGSKEETFLPLVYRIGEDPVVKIEDEAGKNSFDCVHAINDSRCLNSTQLQAGESKQGELIFEVPDRILGKKKPLYVAVSLGNQRVKYQLQAQ